MENSREQSRLSRWLWVICPLIFLYFAFRLWLAAQGKEFWMDETDTIYYNMRRDIWTLIRFGPDDGQASRTPLFYIIERLWLYAWNDLPQRYWDLRFFFRIFPVMAWSAANTYLFAHLWRYFTREQGLRLGTSALFAFAIAQFCYSNNFGCYYAIESRPYAMWAGFSIVHFLAAWQLVRTRDRGWVAYFAGSIGIVLATYAALVQVAIATGWLILEEWRHQRKIVLYNERLRKIMTACLISLFIGAYYFVKRDTMGFAPAPLWLFRDSVLEVLLKSFHHHSYHAAIVTVPLLFVVIPFYWARRRFDLAYTSLHAILIFLSTYPLYWVACKKGALFASRYVIYIVPGLTFLYVLGMITIFVALARWLEQKSGRAVFWKFLVLLAALESVSRGAGLYKGIGADVQRFQARKSFELHEGKDCSTPLPHNPWDLEQVSNNCRGFTAPLPKNPFLPQK